MPAKDNDPKARKTPARARAKTQPEVTDSTVVPAEVQKIPARSRRRSAAADAATSDTEADAKVAPKPRRSVRRTETVTTASSEAVTAPVSTSTPRAGAPTASPSTSSASFHEEVRLRAYLLYAERGYRSGSPESDWFQAEREVAYGRQA
jgi:hypothetical protein